MKLVADMLLYPASLNRRDSIDSLGSPVPVVPVLVWECGISILLQLGYNLVLLIELSERGAVSQFELVGAPLPIQIPPLR